MKLSNVLNIFVNSKLNISKLTKVTSIALQLSLHNDTVVGKQANKYEYQSAGTAIVLPDLKISIIDKGSDVLYAEASTDRLVFYTTKSTEQLAYQAVLHYLLDKYNLFTDHLQKQYIAKLYNSLRSFA